MAPVHADEVQRTVNTECREVAESPTEKGGELGAVHLPRGHRKRTMMDRAEAARVTVDRHVVGRVGEPHRGALLAHQYGEGGRIEGATA